MHIPVLLNEVLQYLKPAAGEQYVDATFGAGGYSQAILKAAACNVLALDRDHAVEQTAAVFKQQFGNRFKFVHGAFGDIKELTLKHSINRVNGIVFDVGVSSMQLEQAERGFSFMHDGKLDMRMDRDSHLTARYLVNQYAERELADIIYRYGDERKSRAIARAIVAARTNEPITTTRELAAVVRRAVGRYNDKIDPATRTFQALRIAVNDELEQLKTGLAQALDLLAAGGRLVVVTFHSGEDRIVKELFNKLTGNIPHANRHIPILPTAAQKIEFIQLHKGAIMPTESEIKQNPRSRSAKLRAIYRNLFPD